MKTDQAIKHFNDSVRELAEALGITSAAVYQWGDDVPQLRVYQINEIIAKREIVAASEMECHAAGTAQPERQVA